MRRRRSAWLMWVMPVWRVRRVRALGLMWRVSQLGLGPAQVSGFRWRRMRYLRYLLLLLLLRLWLWLRLLRLLNTAVWRVTIDTRMLQIWGMMSAARSTVVSRLRRGHHAGRLGLREIVREVVLVVAWVAVRRLRRWAALVRRLVLWTRHLKEEKSVVDLKVSREIRFEPKFSCIEVQ